MKESMTYKDGNAIVVTAMDSLNKANLTDQSVMLFILHLTFYHQISNLISYRELVGENSNNYNVKVNPKYTLGGVPKEVFEIFYKDIQLLDSTILYEVLNPLLTIEDEWYREHYSQLFEDVLNRVTSKQYSYDQVQPIEITNLISRLCGCNDNHSVYNPFAGAASYGVVINPKGAYYAQEIDERTWAIGCLRLVAHRQNIDNYRCQDSVKNWIAKSSAKDSNKLLFDVIVATPPFGQKVSSELNRTDTLRRIVNIDDFFLANGLEDLSPNGKLIGLFAQPILTKGGASELERRFAVDNDLLEKVIALPSHLISGSSVATCILVFNKNKSKKGFVQFIDGESFYNQKGRMRVLDLAKFEDLENNQDNRFVQWVSNDEIVKNDYYLSPKRYLYFELNTNTVRPGFTECKLSDIASVYPFERHDATSGFVVEFPDLSTDKYKFELRPEQLKIKDVSGSKHQKFSAAALLISKVRSINPTYCFANDNNPVFCSRNIAVFVVDTTKIIPEYLALELNSHRVNSFISAHMGAGIVPTISLHDLLEIPLYLPDNFNQQKEIAEKLYRKYQEDKIAELGFELQIIRDSNLDRFEKNMHLRKHALTQLMNKFSPELSLLKLCKERNEGVLQDDLIVAQRTGETVRESFQRLVTLASKLEQLVNNLVDTKTYGEAEWVWVESFLEDYAADQHVINFPVVFHNKRVVMEEDVAFGGESCVSKGETVNSYAISFAKTDLIQVLDNIVVNAERYGFVDSNRKDYQVAISIEEVDNDILIKVANNGKAMHKSISGEKLFTWGGGDGTGLGLWQVRNIVEHFGGEVSVINNESDQFPVEFRIKLKLSNRFIFNNEAF